MSFDDFSRRSGQIDQKDQIKWSSRGLKLHDALLVSVFVQFEIGLAQANQSTIGAAIDHADV